MSNGSSFDPDVFRNTAQEGAHETVCFPVPQGDHRAISSTGKMLERTVEGETRWIYRLRWEVTDEAVKAELEMEEPFVNQDIWLDMENGRLLYGRNKNNQLGLVREALGVNDPSKPFSLRMLEGKGPAMIHVSHRDWQGRPQAQVDRVVKLG